MGKNRQNKLEELLRRTKITTKSRYKASQRLSNYHKYSQWTLAFISSTLIITEVMDFMFKKAI